MLDIFKAEAWEIADAVNQGIWNPSDVAAKYADQVELQYQELNTHINWDKSNVLNAAEKQFDYIAAAIKAKKTLPLAGVPIVIKDNLMTKDSITTCGSKFLENHRAAYDSTVIEKLRSAGAIFMGRSNMDEFAMGSSNENSAWGPVKNPVNKTRVPGGSSGGSAASVAASFAPLAIGTDTGGSIRQPASFCGVVGMKPSYGLVSRYGLVAFASSFDQIGPVSKTVKDSILLFDVIAGHDEKDSTSSKTTVEPISAKVDSWKDLKGMKVGLVEECFSDGLDSEVKGSVQQSIESLRQCGAEVKTVSIPSFSYGTAVYYILTTAEASSNLSRFDGVRFGKRGTGDRLEDLYLNSRSNGFGREVKQRIMLGTYALSSGYYDAYYQKASRLRELITREVESIFNDVDLLVMPTSPSTAFEIGQKSRDPMSMYLSDIYTIIANITKTPAISIPCGEDSSGLPIGLQIMAPRFKEETLFKGAYLYEQSRK